MKKMLSVVLAIAMLASFAAVNALAEITLEDIIANYTADSFTDGESELAVTKDLILSDSFGDGVIASWSSSDAGVIADDGSVARDVYEKRTATMTLTLSKEGEEDVSKSFTYTVLPFKTKAYASESFASVLTPATTSLANTSSGWTELNNKKTLSYTVEIDSATNSRYTNIYRSEANSSDYSLTTYCFPDYTELTTAEMSVDIRIPSVDSARAESQSYNIEIKTENNKSVANAQFTRNTDGTLSFSLVGKGKGKNWEYDKWYTLRFKLDRTISSNNAYAEIADKSTGAVLTSQTASYDPEDASYSGSYIKGIYICPYRGNAYDRSVDVDNLIVTKTDISFVPSEYKDAVIADYTADSFTDGESEFAVTKDLILTDSFGDGVIASWSSSDTGVIADDGSVTRDVFEPKTATMTLTLSKEGEEDVSKSFTYTVLPLKMKVYASENFASAIAPATTSFPNTSSGWTELNKNGTLSYTVDIDSATNSRYTNISRSEANNSDYSMTTYCFPDYTELTTAEVSVDIRIPSADSQLTESESYNIEVSSEDNKRVANAQFVRNTDGTLSLFLVGTGKGKSWEYDKWYTLRFRVDRTISLNNTYAEIVDKSTGTVLTSQTASRDPKDASYSGSYVKGIYTYPYRGNAYDRSMDVDNLIVTKTDISLIPDEYKAELYADMFVLEEGEVTGDITLPDIEVPGGTVSWSSDKPAVLSNTGVVTRSYGSDENVTLTLSVTVGGNTATRYFHFTVLAVGKEIVYSENFEGKTMFTDTSFKSYQDSDNRVLITDDPVPGGSNGKVLTTSYQPGDATRARIYLSSYTASGIVSVESSILFDAMDGETAPEFTFDLRGKDAENAQHLAFNLMFNYQIGEIYVSSLGEKYVISKQLPKLGEWHTIKAVMDITADTTELYIDGVLMNVSAPIPMKPADKDIIKFSYFTTYLTSGFGSVYIDNFSLVQNTDEDTVGAVSAVNNALKPFLRSLTTASEIADGVVWTTEDTDFNASIGSTMTFTNSGGCRVINLTATKNVGNATYSREATVEASPAAVDLLSIFEQTVNVDVAAAENAQGNVFVAVYTDNTMTQVKEVVLKTINSCISYPAFTFKDEISPENVVRVVIFDNNLNPLSFVKTLQMK